MVTFVVDKIHNKITEIIKLDVNNNIKSILLKEIEQSDYKPLLKKFAYAENIKQLRQLIEILSDLGALSKVLGDLISLQDKVKSNQEIAKINDKFKHYTDSAIFYQYIIYVEKEKIKSKNLRKIEAIYSKLNKLNETILSEVSLLSKDKQQEIIKSINIQQESEGYKKILTDLRVNNEKTIKLIETYQRRIFIKEDQNVSRLSEILYVNRSEELFNLTTNKITEFLGKLYEKAEKEIGKPPCKYTVIGLGSLSQTQATSFSDLEFAILTENDNYKTNANRKLSQYFRNISQLVHFKVINLGETIIPTSRYELDMSHLIRKAVQFDLGGKTPLGRIDRDKPYDLIQTVENMIHYVRNVDNKFERIDKALPYILLKVCYIYGDLQLIQTYKKQVTNFLSSKTRVKKSIGVNFIPNYKIVAEKLMKGGFIEVNRFNVITKTKSDLDRFNPFFKFGADETLNIKQEIYRLPDRILYNLGLYYGIEDNSAWNIIDTLYRKSIINDMAVINLKYAISFASILRFKTYLHYKHQKEFIPLPINNFLENVEERGVFKYFYTVFQIYKKVANFFHNHIESKNYTFKSINFCQNNHEYKGIIYSRLMQHEKAQNNLELALKEDKNESNIYIRFILINSHLHSGNFNKVINLLKQLYTMVSRTCGEEISNTQYIKFLFEETSPEFINEIQKLLITNCVYVNLDNTLNLVQGITDKLKINVTKSLFLSKLCTNYLIRDVIKKSDLTTLMMQIDQLQKSQNTQIKEQGEIEKTKKVEVDSEGTKEQNITKIDNGNNNAERKNETILAEDKLKHNKSNSQIQRAIMNSIEDIKYDKGVELSKFQEMERKKFNIKNKKQKIVDVTLNNMTFNLGTKILSNEEEQKLDKILDEMFLIGDSNIFSTNFQEADPLVNFLEDNIK